MQRPPYKPFHAGPPRFQVGLSQIPPGEWLAPDPEADFLAIKAARLDQGLAPWFRERADSRPAQEELLAMVEGALDTPAPATAEPPLVRAGRMVSDDLILMQQRDQAWFATAMLLCAPTFFSLEESFDRELHGLHRPVPGGDPHLAGKITRIFDRMPVRGVFERFNWTVQIGDERHWPHGREMRDHLHRLGPQRASQSLYLRVERQTLVKLPDTGGVVFAIRVCLDPLADALRDPADLSAFAESWRAASADALRYKRWGDFAPAVECLLDRLGAPDPSLRSA